MPNWALLVAVLAFSSPRAFAQVPAAQTDIETRVEEAQRKKQAQAQQQKAASEAEKRETPGAQADVTYEQVLAAPDDIDLNFRYATSEVRKGNLRGAAATLERILLVNPNLPKVRLFYAVVLFRLDNLDDAERELETLKKEAMPDSLRAEVEQYVKEIRKRRSTSHVSAQVGGGVDFDDNKNAAPASNIRLLADTPFNLNSDSTRKTDWAKTMMASLGYVYDLPIQGGHQLFADAGFYRAQQTKQTTLNIQNYSVDFGLNLKSTRFCNLTPSFEFNHLKLDETTYLRSAAGKLLLSRRLSPLVEAFATAGYTNQSFSRTQIVTNGDQFSGEKVEGGGGASVAWGPAQKFTLSYAHANVGAGISKFYAYARESVTASHSWFLGRGQFLLSSLTYNYDTYEQPDPSVSTKVRYDDTLRPRATYGFPLSLFVPGFQNAVWTFTYEYYHAFSNITNYAYTDNKVSTMLTYKWEVGLR